MHVWNDNDFPRHERNETKKFDVLMVGTSKVRITRAIITEAASEMPTADIASFIAKSL